MGKFSRSILTVCCVTLVASPFVAGAQSTRWVVGAGPSASLGTGRVALGPSGPLAGAVSSGHHALLGLERRLGESAVDLRLELSGNQAGTRYATYFNAANYPSVRAATRDRAGAISIGAVFHAQRGARVSPYLLAGFGYMYSALGTNPDDQSASVTQQVVRHGIAGSMGAGVNLRVGTRDLFVEARRFAKSTPGADYLPISLGLRF